MNRNHLKSLSSQLGGAKQRRRTNGTRRRSAFATVSFILAASLLAVLLAACPSTSTDTTPPTFTLSEIAGRTGVKTLTIVADEAITLLSADDAVNKSKLTVTNDVGDTDTDVPVTGATLGTDGMTVTIAIDPPVDFVAGKKVSVKIAADFAQDKATTPNKNLEDTKEVTVTEDTTAPTFTLDAISPSTTATTLTLTASEPITLLGADAAANAGKLTVKNDAAGASPATLTLTEAALDADEVTVTITVNSATTFTAGQKVSVEIAADFAADKATTPNKNVATTDPHLEVTVADTEAPEFTLSAITAGSSDTLTLEASEAIALLGADAAANVAKLTVKNDAAGTSPATLTVSTVALDTTDEMTVTITLDAAATFTAGQEVSVDIEADFAKDKAATPNNNAAATVKKTVEAVKFTVSYELNDGGAGTAPASVEVANGETIATAPTAPTRTGYTFTGWFDAATAGTEFDFGAAGTGTAVTADITLHAQWTINQYTVTYDANNGTGAPNQATVNHGETIATAPTAPTRTGYTFTGWDTTAAGTGTAFEFGGAGTGTEVTADITLYAQWTADWTVDNVGYTAFSTNPAFTAGTAVASLATLDFAGTALVAGTDFEVTLVDIPTGATQGHVTLSTGGVIGVTGDIVAADAGAYTFKVGGIGSYSSESELTNAAFTFTLDSN